MARGSQASLIPRLRRSGASAVMSDLPSLLHRRRLNAVVEKLSSVVTALVVRHRIAGLQRLVKQGQLEIGSNTYGLPVVYVSHPDDRVMIGRYCSIAPEVTMIPGGIHPVNAASTFPFLRRWGLQEIDSAVLRRGPIVIGDDVWLCTGSIILSGVHIGTGAVVAAGAVVTSDVNPYEVVGGIPARSMGKRFDDATIEALLESSWWEWPESEISKVIPLMGQNQIDAFLQYVVARTDRPS